MIYGRQSVKQSASRPAGRPASRTGTACTIPLAINAGIILIRSILDPRSLSLLLLAINFCSQGSETEKLGRKRNGGKEWTRKWKRKAAEKLKARRRTGQAIRSRAGCVQLEEKLEICGSRPARWSQEGRLEKRIQLWGTVGPFMSFLPPSDPLLPFPLPSLEQKEVADCEWQLSEPELTSPSSCLATHRLSQRYDTSFPTMEFREGLLETRISFVETAMRINYQDHVLIIKII